MSIPPEVAELGAAFLQRNLESIYELGKGVFGSAKEKLQLRLRGTYSNYIHSASERFGKSKSFFIRSAPTYIYDFYIPLGVTCGDVDLESATVAEIEALTSRAVITGTAGSGKSMLMRHLFLDALANGSKVPVFVELRTLNELDDKVSLHDLILSALEHHGFSLGTEFIEKAIDRGHFLLLFDGLDEIPIATRRSVSRQMSKLSSRASECMIVLSSRPDDTFSNWDEFSDLRINPLSLDDACRLVEKLPHDDEVKEKFSSDLRESLFEKHESFLSNPLLLSIMLLTYGQNAKIPNKLSLFYDQAYEALFQKHDALKGGFQRDRSTALDIQDFARVFSAFCLRTYDQHKYQNTRSECLSHFEKARRQIEIEFSSSDFLEDCLQSVCLLVEDGMQISFAHRSFQEYFVARFIVDTSPNVQKRLIKRFRSRFQVDNVIALLLEMNRDLCEREFVLPELENLFTQLKVKRAVGITHYLRFLQLAFTEMRLVPRDGLNQAGMYFSGRGGKNIMPSLLVFVLSEVDRSRRDQIATREEFESYWNDLHAEFGEKNREALFPLDDLTIHSPVIRRLAEGPGAISLECLGLVYQSYKELKSKHKNTLRSLDSLLD